MTKRPLTTVEKVAAPEVEHLFDYYYDEQGSLPGTISIEEDATPPEIILIDYNETNATRVELETPEACIPYLQAESVSWVDVRGLGSEEILKRLLGEVFNLHPLVLEEVVNVPQRPKVEDYQDQLVVISQMVILKEKGDGFSIEQVGFILGKSYLLTIQENPEHDCFGAVRDRIILGKGIIRSRSADFLLYALLDALIDGFFPVLEDYGERIEELEDEVVLDPSRQTLEKIYHVRRELLALRRSIWPQRVAINKIVRDNSHPIGPEAIVYFRNCYDHAIQVMDIVETYRELTSGLMDVYLSSVSNKMNEIMKILTVISTIFIPLTFVAGIYGMNFNPEASPLNMPELNWYWGYPACWGVMVAIASGLIFFFWRRGWFENTSAFKDD